MRGQRPRDPAYELRTIGDRIRCRRLELAWTQEEAARWFRVDACTIRNWELGATTPTPLSRTAIRIFLGEASDDDAFPEQVRKLRWQLQLTQADLARRLGVNRSTVVDWETGRCRANSQHRKALGGLRSRARVDAEHLLGTS